MHALRRSVRDLRIFGQFGPKSPRELVQQGTTHRIACIVMRMVQVEPL
jgi:hypothetical protein